MIFDVMEDFSPMSTLHDNTGPALKIHQLPTEVQYSLFCICLHWITFIFLGWIKYLKIAAVNSHSHILLVLFPHGYGLAEIETINFFTVWESFYCRFTASNKHELFTKCFEEKKDWKVLSQSSKVFQDMNFQLWIWRGALMQQQAKLGQ